MPALIERRGHVDASELDRFGAAGFGPERQALRPPIPSQRSTRRRSLSCAGRSTPANVLAMMLDPSAVRPFVANWEVVASTLVARVRREALGGVPDDTARQLLAEMARFPGVSELLARAEPIEPLVPVVPVSFEKAAHRFDFFSTVTVLGTPQDITAQEIRIECFFPAHPETERAARELLGAPRPPAV